MEPLRASLTRILHAPLLWDTLPDPRLRAGGLPEDLRPCDYIRASRAVSSGFIPSRSSAKS